MYCYDKVMSDTGVKEVKSTTDAAEATPVAEMSPPAQRRDKMWRDKLKEYGAAVLLGIWSRRIKEHNISQTA